MTNVQKKHSSAKVLKKHLWIMLAYVLPIFITRHFYHIPKPPAPPLSPTLAIALIFYLTIGAIGGTMLYLHETDEHDLSANLWAAMWGWMTVMVGTVGWQLLHLSGAVPVPNAMAIAGVSTAVCLAAWLWNRFR